MPKLSQLYLLVTVLHLVVVVVDSGVDFARIVAVAEELILVVPIDVVVVQLQVFPVVGYNMLKRV